MALLLFNPRPGPIEPTKLAWRQKSGLGAQYNGQRSRGAMDEHKMTKGTTSAGNEPGAGWATKEAAKTTANASEGDHA